MNSRSMMLTTALAAGLAGSARAQTAPACHKEVLELAKQIRTATGAQAAQLNYDRAVQMRSCNWAPLDVYWSYLLAIKAAANGVAPSLSLQARRGLADAMCRDGQHADGLAHFDKALAAAPGDQETSALRAECVARRDAAAKR